MQSEWMGPFITILVSSLVNVVVIQAAAARWVINNFMNHYKSFITMKLVIICKIHNTDNKVRETQVDDDIRGRYGILWLS